MLSVVFEFENKKVLLVFYISKQSTTENKVKLNIGRRNIKDEKQI